MPFVKIDCGILDSTLWLDREAREVFLTALLMAVPWDTDRPMSQLDIHTMLPTGWSVPPGWYGFAAASGPGIVRRAGLDLGPGKLALERLGQPEPESRSDAHEGRRLVRVDGGYVILNYMTYREKDLTNAERQRRWRDRHKDNALRNDVTVNSNDVTLGNGLLVTQAEAEAEAEGLYTPPKAPPLTNLPGLNQAAFAEWDAERRGRCGKSKNRWSALAQTKAANLMAKYSPEEQQSMVDSAIAGGWDGLHPPNGKEKPPKDTGWNIGVYK